MMELRGGFFFLVLSLFVVWQSFRFGIGTLRTPGSGFLPFCAGVVIFGLSLVQILRSWTLRKSQKSYSHHLMGFLVITAMFLYSFVLQPAGFVVATFFLVALLFRLTAPRPWWTLLWMSALVTCTAYVGFHILLRIYFPRGFVERLLMP